MLYDEVLGYLLLFRCPSALAPSVPLYWGTDADGGDVLLLSTHEAPGLALFPPGCAFEVCSTASCLIAPPTPPLFTLSIHGPHLLVSSALLIGA